MISVVFWMKTCVEGFGIPKCGTRYVFSDYVLIIFIIFFNKSSPFFFVVYESGFMPPPPPPPRPIQNSDPRYVV